MQLYPNFETARRIEFEPFETVKAVVADVEAALGKNFNIVFAHRPPMYIPEVGI